MDTTADFAVFQQQLRQEMIDVTRQLRTEMNETANGRMDMLNSIPERIHEDNCVQAVSNQWFLHQKLGGKEEFRSFMSDFVLMHASMVRPGWANLGESKERWQGWSGNIGRGLHGSRIQIFRNRSVPGLAQDESKWTIEDDSTRRRIERIWGLIVRRCYQRQRMQSWSATSPKGKERRGDEILSTFTNEMIKFDMTKFENSFGKIRDLENVFAVKKFMPESLLNYRFRGTAMPYGELIIALENFIIDKVSTVFTARSRKHDTSAPTEIGMATKEDGENAS